VAISRAIRFLSPGLKRSPWLMLHSLLGSPYKTVQVNNFK